MTQRLHSHPDAKAAFLASLEYGINPLVRYERRRPLRSLTRDDIAQIRRERAAQSARRKGQTA
ncbi:hypothetical protein [Antribacter gilvus]|uniref:hypothetical protein n=1 Tax=Antribacter gilvus TaxID=2304675 RepID=UPI000F7A0B77|nr:hypothetical protein [Antribacter gilvus]